MSKTVGLQPPPACASTSSITVQRGTMVWFCYSLTAPAKSAVSYALVDDKLGTITEGVTVPAGGKDRQFASWVADLSTKNLARWDAQTGNGPIVEEATASVNVFGPASTFVAAGLAAVGAGFLLAGLFLLRRFG